MYSHMTPNCYSKITKRKRNRGVSVKYRGGGRIEAKRFKAADKNDVSAPIPMGFENIPISKGSYLLPDGAKKLVIPFLQKYYSIFDSRDDGELFYAYHEQAKLTIRVVKGLSNLQFHAPEGWNYLRVHNSKNELKLFKQGRSAVVRTLSQLPEIQHNLKSFAIDLSYVSVNLMSFSVTGVFEVAVDNQLLRTFHRTFLVVPQDQGCVVISDIFCIANATAEQMKSYKSPSPTASPSPSLISTGVQSTCDKSQLVIEVMDATGMNSRFSAKCLSDSGWNINKACVVFGKLNALGRIPEEAFIT